MLDLSSLRLQTDKPARLILLHPTTREPFGGTIDLWSLDSEQARAFNRRIAESRAGKQKRVTAAEVESDAVNLLTVLTAGWNLTAPDGSALDLPFTEANARDLLCDPGCQWIREQVEVFVASRANYLPPTWG